MLWALVFLPLQLAQPVRADLSKLGTGDFRLAFTLKTRAQVSAAVINQRGECSHGNFWDIRMSPTGALGIETDGDDYTVLMTGDDVHVNDGKPHRVTLTRRRGMLTVAIDNGRTIGARSGASFAQLAPLAVGHDVCEHVDGTEALEGSVTDITLVR